MSQHLGPISKLILLQTSSHNPTYKLPIISTINMKLLAIVSVFIGLAMAVAVPEPAADNLVSIQRYVNCSFILVFPS